MRANLFVRTALKVAPAVFAAAIELEPGMVWATTFVVTGDPGSAIEIDTYPEGPNGLEMFINTSEAGVTFEGAAGLFSLSFTDSSTAGVPLGAGLYQQNMTGGGSFSVTDSSYTSYRGTWRRKCLGNAWRVRSDCSNSPSRKSTGLAASGYLVLQGSTRLPVALVTTNPYCGVLGLDSSCAAEPYFDPIGLDWTATYRATPYSPPLATAPEPSNLGADAARFRRAQRGGLAPQTVRLTGFVKRNEKRARRAAGPPRSPGSCTFRSSAVSLDRDDRNATDRQRSA